MYMNVKESQFTGGEVKDVMGHLYHRMKDYMATQARFTVMILFFFK